MATWKTSAPHLRLRATGWRLLKTMHLSDVAQVDGRWVPKHVVYKDVQKEGEGTEFIIVSVESNPLIPDDLFSKTALRK